MNEEDITRSQDPALANSRVFIGKLPSDKTTKEDLQEKFKKYGKILGISIHKGFGFVQYDSERDANKAVEGEHGSTFKGSVLDLRISSQGRGRKPQSNKRPHDDDLAFRDAWHLSDPHSSNPYWQDRGGQQPPPRFGDSMSRDDPYRFPPGPMMAPPRNGAPPHDMYRDDRGAPFGGGQPPANVMNEQPPGMPKKIEYGVERPFDAVIIVTQKNLKMYAEMLERRLFELNLTVDMIFLLHDGALNKAIDDMTRRGVLYVLVVQPQHEEHKSVTVNIMHGTPQEHRNMPLDDALVMMGRNFNAYLNALRCGSEQPTMGFLLNLLADGKHLSVVELDRIIAHLQDRRDRLIESEGGRKDQPPVQHVTPAGSAAGGGGQSALHQKILGILGNNLLNPAGGAPQPQPQQTSAAAAAGPPPPSLALMNLAQQFGINLSQSSPLPPTSAAAVSMANMPKMSADANMKKTLDSLLQNPNLLNSLVRPPQQQQGQQQGQGGQPPGGQQQQQMPQQPGGGGGRPQFMGGPPGGGPPSLFCAPPMGQGQMRPPFGQHGQF